MDELDNLRRELGCVVDTMIGIKHSCIRHNDRDGEVYAQGKIDAYTCVIACLTDILEDDEDESYYPY